MINECLTKRRFLESGKSDDIMECIKAASLQLGWCANIGAKVLPQGRPVHADEKNSKIRGAIKKLRRSSLDGVRPSARGHKK